MDDAARLAALNPTCPGVQIPRQGGIKFSGPWPGSERSGSRRKKTGYERNPLDSEKNPIRKALVKT